MCLTGLLTACEQAVSKPVHLVGFIIRIRVYHDARSPGRHIDLNSCIAQFPLHYETWYVIVLHDRLALL